jgi:hypothetical protein
VAPSSSREDADRDELWSSLVNAPGTPETRAFGVAACRETLEEAALLLADMLVSDEDILSLRARQAADAGALAAFLRERDAKLDLGALAQLSRWITPRVESRRFDARFFVARAPRGQSGAHDMTETMASFWDTPRGVLARFDCAEIQLAPPTHRTLQTLATCANVDATMAMARAACLDPICPELVQQGDTVALTLPGDPQHSIREARIPGVSRYVLRDAHWRPEGPPED